MDTESERIFDRMKLHRLLEKEPERDNKSLAAEIGRCATWVGKWRERF